MFWKNFCKKKKSNCNDLRSPAVLLHVHNVSYRHLYVLKIRPVTGPAAVMSQNLIVTVRASSLFLFLFLLLLSSLLCVITVQLTASRRNIQVFYYQLLVTSCLPTFTQFTPVQTNPSTCANAQKSWLPIFLPRTCAHMQTTLPTCSHCSVTLGFFLHKPATFYSQNVSLTSQLLRSVSYCCHSEAN